jgi:small neutral amino acid transporter SnatA (MarC family)
VTGSTWLVVVAVVAVVNPARLSPALQTLPPVLPDSTSIRRARSVAVVALGAGVAVSVLAVLAAASARLLDAIDVSAPTMRVAAGLVLILAVIRDLIGGRPTAEPALRGWGAALVPVAMPFVARPELAILVVSAATVEGLGVTLLALILVVALTALVTLVGGSEPSATVVEWAGWTLAATGVVVGVAFVVDGVYGV